MCTNKIEPFIVDHRKLVCLNEPSLGQGEMFSKYRMIYMDDFVDMILREEIVFGVTLPFLPKRFLLEDQGLLPEYHSPIEDEYVKIYGERGVRKRDNEILEESDGPSDKAHEKPADQSMEESDQSMSDHSDKPKSKKKNENSIEYWNELRAKQGLKPLKGPESRGEGNQSQFPNHLPCVEKKERKSKKSKRHRRRSDSDSGREDSRKKKKNENSIEYWNELRAKQGLKPLLDNKKEQKEYQGNSLIYDCSDSHMKKDKRNNDRKRRREDVDKQDESSKQLPKDTTSVEYWNELRAKQGLKPLKR